MNKNVALLLFLLLIGLMLAWPITYFAGQLEKEPEQHHLHQLDQLAEDFFQATKQGDIERSRQHIAKIAELFPNLTLPVTIRIESLNAVTQSILAAKQTFVSPRVSEERLLWHATQVRIAIDALHHEHQPIWKNYYPSFTNQLQNLMQAVVERDLTEFRAQFDEQYYLYLAIRPAMSIQVDEQEMSAIDAAYELIIREMRNESPDWQVIRDSLRELSVVMQSVFVGEERSAAGGPWMPGSPLTIIMTIAIVVMLPLTYVGWRKYLAEVKG
ncbi:sporulation protein YpjB [Brevibacillus humidisoli]|uniref:sporulation protein YpjB n=1 Tax=Brevibacillus humidisoli TaxID=2895522 RepID=UPI001E48347A|nr:sporulation protein YpjB [Brevibacillus humidisoli]UFJ42755.1 sporulation protein YpjB [Brevibacillus humidisoli]